MNHRLRRTLARRPRDHVDEGFTLIELVVAMSIFSVLISVFLAGMVIMTKNTVRVQAVANANDEITRAFSRMDKQVRYAEAVNLPTRVGNDWYVEFLTTAAKSGVAPFCTQWRLHAADHTLQERIWTHTTSAVSPTFVTVASHVINNPTTEQPFTVLLAGTTYTRQRLQVFLNVQQGNLAGSQLRSQFVALNTSTATVTNTDANGDGASDTQVCTEAGRP